MGHIHSLYQNYMKSIQNISLSFGSVLIESVKDLWALSNCFNKTSQFLEGLSHCTPSVPHVFWQWCMPTLKNTHKLPIKPQYLWSLSQWSHIAKCYQIKNCYTLSLPQISLKYVRTFVLSPTNITLQIKCSVCTTVWISRIWYTFIIVFVIKKDKQHHRNMFFLLFIFSNAF